LVVHQSLEGYKANLDHIGLNEGVESADIEANTKCHEEPSNRVLETIACFLPWNLLVSINKQHYYHRNGDHDG